MRGELWQHLIVMALPAIAFAVPLLLRQWRGRDPERLDLRQMQERARAARKQARRGR